MELDNRISTFLTSHFGIPKINCVTQKGIVITPHTSCGLNNFRCNNIYGKLLDWKVSPNTVQFDTCLSFNFGYHDINLLIPQLAMTPDSKMKLKFDSPIGCLIVMIGGKYLNRVGNVMEKVNSVTNDVGGIRPLAVFLISNKFMEDVVIDVNYGFERYKHSPVMVKILMDIFI